MLNPVELERSVLNGVLCFGRQALEAIPLVTVEDFASPVHREIFTAALELDADGIAVELGSVYAHLGLNQPARSLVNEISSIAGPIPQQLKGLGSKLRSLSTLRRMNTLAREISSIQSRNGQSPEAMVAEGVKLARQIVEGAAVTTSPTVSFSEIAEQEIARLERIQAGEKTPEGIRTGIGDLDLMFYGFEPGSLVIVAGETSSGKSGLCGQIAVREARRGHPVAFITSEMTHRQMLARMVAHLSGIPVEDLINPKRAAEVGAIAQYRSFGDLPIEFQRVFPPTLEQAATTIRYLAAEKGIRLAVIDYAQRLAQLDDENQEQAIAAIAHEAKNLALELNIVVLAAAQVNRQVSNRTDPRPKLADLRGSGRLEQDADTVLFIYQPGRHGQPGDPEIIVAKNRNGKTGPVTVTFRPDTCTFAGLAGFDE